MTHRADTEYLHNAAEQQKLTYMSIHMRCVRGVWHCLPAHKMRSWADCSSNVQNEKQAYVKRQTERERERERKCVMCDR